MTIQRLKKALTLTDRRTSPVPLSFYTVKSLTSLFLTIFLVIGCSTVTTSGPVSISGNFAETPLSVVEVPDNAIDYTGQAEVFISMDDNSFRDRIIIVSTGTNITWTNTGRNRHNVTPSLEEGDLGWFPSLNESLFDEGGSASSLFEKSGYFPYFCTFHGTATRGQTGQIFVVAG